MQPNVRRVWILGAGFSRSLGGPLLADLFTPESANALRVRFPSAKHFSAPVFGQVRALYRFGSRSLRKEPGVGVQEHWDDPEDFLDQLDSACRAQGSAPRDRFDGIIKTVWATSPEYAHLGRPPLRELRSAARRLLAAECASFLVSADTKTERWSPYVRWLGSLTHNDVIVSFNYDFVLETISKAENIPLATVLPHNIKSLDDRRPRLIKMHGSVDWKKITASDPSLTRFEATKQGDFCINCDEHELAIASPGPSKAESVGELRPIWDLALAELRRSDWVSFVGYRFPPTDATARDELLGALLPSADARGLGARRGISLVLGPNVHSQDVERLRGLLSITNADVRPLPMFAQDFLGLAEHILP